MNSTVKAGDILAYTYEADYHCIDCTRQRFSDDGKVHGTESDRAKFRPCTDYNGIWYEQLDSEGNFVHPVFYSDEWYDLDKPSVFADGTCDHDWDWQCVCNDDQHLICGDCHIIIDQYSI